MAMRFGADRAAVGKLRRIKISVMISVTGAETNVALARLGLGLIQGPRYHVEADLASGALVEILADYPPPPSQVSVLYPHNRQLSPRVRVCCRTRSRRD
jgi:DNA-binding transcriptional LysR family regulator